MMWLMRILLFVGGTTAQAQSVDIRSGDHDRFTRLVLTIPNGTDWQVRQSSTGYQLGLENTALEFNVGDIFDRITRSRLADVSGSAGQLNLALSCACHLDVFLFQPDMLVLDVIDGPAANGEIFTANANPVRPAFGPTARPAVDTPRLAIPQDQTPETPLSNAANQGTPIQSIAPIDLPLFTVPDSTTNTLPIPLPRFAAQTPRDPNLAEAERAILESFARAATQGIFDFPARPLAPLPAEGDDPARTLIAPMTDPMDGVAIPLAAADPQGPGFLLRTGIDRVALADAEEPLPQNCPLGINFDINTWGTAGGYGDLIPQLRLDTIDAAGQQQPQAIFELAQAYIYYGFGLEARRTLSRLPTPTDRATYLSLIANLVDGNDVAVADLLPYRACGEMMEAWLTLARGRLDTADEGINSAILMATRAFPDPLRGHLGIELSQIFARAGELYNAQEILAASMRTITGQGPEALRATADLSGLTDGPEAEAEQLDAFVQTNPRAAPADMVRLMELARAQNTPLEGSVLEIAETMRFEANDTRAATDLVEAEVLLMLDQGQFENAMGLLDADVGPMPPERLQELRGEAMVVLAATATDDAFLEFAFSPQAQQGTISSDHAIAARLLDLGFAEQSLELIQAPITGPLFDARVALQLRARAAISETSQQETPPAPIPRPEEQISEAEPQIEPTSSLETAWRDGSWEELRQSDDPLLRSAGQALLTQTAPLGTDSPLADTQDLLDQAQEARDLADGLLSRFALDDTVAPDSN